jgi:hypothetical protein
MLSKNAAFGTLGLGVDIDALVGLPDTGQSAQRSKVGQIVRRDVRLGEDVGRNRQHESLPAW